MDRNQLTAAIALLDRSVPKLQQIQHSGDENNPVQIVNQYKWDE